MPMNRRMRVGSLEMMRAKRFGDWLGAERNISAATSGNAQPWERAQLVVAGNLAGLWFARPRLLFDDVAAHVRISLCLVLG
jgi:hypothetical protein